MNLNLRTAPTTAAHLRVDAEGGIIFGVPVVTAGMTMPSGGGNPPFMVDSLSLQQIADAINRQGAVRSRITHPELEGTDDITVRVGVFRTARVVGDKVLADFYAGSYAASDHKALIFGLATEDPSSFGVSIVSTTARLEPQGNALALRLTELDAIDFVGTPAANPGGLLSSAYQEPAMLTAKITDHSPDRAARLVQDAMLVKIGAPLIHQHPDGRIVTGANGRAQVRQPDSDAITLSRAPLHEIGAQYLRLTGGHEGYKIAAGPRVTLCKTLMHRPLLRNLYPHLDLNRRISLAVATGDYPNLLADTMHKAVLGHYAAVRRTWRAWCRQGFVADYKQADRIRLEDAPLPVETDPGALIEFGTLPENPRERLALAKYTRGYKVTRETLLNDDTAALASVPQLLADAAGRLEDVTVYAHLTANGQLADSVALFATAHGNITTGTLTTTNLSAAIAAMAKQTNDNGDVLDIQPAILLVPSALRATAESVLSSMSQIERADQERPLRLLSTAHLDAASATQWYLLADPSEMALVEVAFLQGQEQPQLAEDAEFDTDSVRYKVTHSLVAKAIDYRAGVRSTGA